jgi:hypothetical protein
MRARWCSYRRPYMLDVLYLVGTVVVFAALLALAKVIDK